MEVSAETTNTEEVKPAKRYGLSVQQAVLDILECTIEEFSKLRLEDLSNKAYDKGFTFESNSENVLEPTILLRAETPKAKELLTEFLPGIKKATLLIALDNGGINCNRSQEQQISDTYDFVFTTHKIYDVSSIDTWLNSLSEEDLQNVCVDSTSVLELLKQAPAHTEEFLDRYFEEVC